MWKSGDESNKNKRGLKRRAKPILDHDGVEDRNSKVIEDTAKKPGTEVMNNLMNTNDIIKCQTKPEPLGIIQPIDVPDNLALLDETLSNMRERLINHQDQIDVNSDLSVRFDCLLHTLETIVNLTKQVPELNVISQETLKKPMDNIARIMNGLKKTLYKQ